MMNLPPVVKCQDFLRDTNKSSDSESEQPIGPSRKKMRYSVKHSSDDKISPEEEQNEGYRLISLRNVG